MGGGQTIVYGILILLVFLAAITRGDMFKPLVHLIRGGVPLLLIAVGALLVYLGIGDLRSKRAKPGGSDSAS